MTRKPETRRWLQMGVELEGGWTRAPYGVLAEAVKGAAAKRDGSVKIPTPRCDVGEITTRPHTVLDQLCKDVEMLHPDIVNETCGFHIHTSFNLMDHSLLATKEFYEYFRARWKDWGEENEKLMGPQAEYFWARWNGRKLANTQRNFCADENNSIVQLSDPNQDHRYTALNFSAWHKYKTIENRLLPMMPTTDLALSAIRHMSDIYDSYLTEAKLPEIRLVRDFKETEDGYLVEEVAVVEPDLTPQLWDVTRKVKIHQITPEDSIDLGPKARNFMAHWGDDLGEDL